MILVVVIIHKREDAVRIGKELLQARLAAGYNLISVDSEFWWKGKSLAETETMVLLKTQEQHFDHIVNYVISQLGYEVPEIFALDPAQAVTSYVSWVHAESRG